MENNVVVVNDHDEVIGVMPREEAHRDGTPHRIVVVYVTDRNGKILIQVRMTGRLDHSSAGHVDPGEEYLQAAHRELEEELGINGVNLIFIGSGISREVVKENEENRTHFFQVFTCIAEPGSLQPEEVKDVYWADPEEILQEMKNNPEDRKFSGGFRESLPIYIGYKTKQLGKSL